MSGKLKNLWITAIIVFLMCCMLVMPSVCIDGATFGLLLWFNKLLPSLLPFIILTQMLCSLGFVTKLSRVISPLTHKLFHLDGTSFLVFIMGLIAGYPTGAKMTKQLLDQEHLSHATAQKCLCFVNNCGPLFIIGTVGSILLKNVSLGYFLALTHILSAFTMLLLSRFYRIPTSMPHKNTTHLPAPSFITVFNQAVQGGMDTIVYVGGYIIFFSMISNIFKHLPIFNHLLVFASNKLPLSYDFLSGLIYGSIEFSSGIALVTQTNPLTPTTLALIAFILTFGGFCVFFQSSYVLQGSHLKLGVYLACKLLQAIVAAIYTLLLFPLFFTTSQLSTAAPIPELLFTLFLLVGSAIVLFKTAIPISLGFSKEKRR